MPTLSIVGSVHSYSALPLGVSSKQRFFFAKYFDVVEESYDRQQIVLRYQQQYIELNLAQAPDFMDQSAYLTWLRQQLNL